MKDTEKDSDILLKSLTYDEIYVQSKKLYSENYTFKKRLRNILKMHPNKMGRLLI